MNLLVHSQSNDRPFLNDLTYKFIINFFSLLLGLWAVVHLAGTGVKTSYQKGGDDEQQLRTALEVTVVGMLRLVRACLPHLSAAKGKF